MFQNFFERALVHATNTAHYALSRIFEMRNPGNELYLVLAVLKHLTRPLLLPQSGVGINGGVAC